MQINDKQPTTAHPAILNLGFRPFFAAAAMFSVLSMLVWSGMYLVNMEFPSMVLPPVTWHAHEMIYGYSQAVIAGFLLAAVSNWTGRPTLRGVPLLLLVLLWLAGRILLVAGETVPLFVLACVDNAFTVGLIITLLVPILRTRQWKQLGILSKLLLLLASNLAFYAGMAGVLDDGIRIGLYSGVYLIIALILVLSRRVFPFFIERGVGYPVELKNRWWLDSSSLLLFLAFWIAEIIRPDTLVVGVLALALMVLHTVRLAGWYTVGIWKKPLLWVLYLGYAWLIIAFALKAAAGFFGLPAWLSLHAFTYGGIGMITLGMMSRVTLGHTGRSVADPPPALFRIFATLLAGAVIRTLLPLFDAQHYSTWIGLSQALWVIAFVMFLSVFLPMLVKPRIDGQPG